jgi:hypothetical protein
MRFVFSFLSFRFIGAQRASRTAFSFRWKGFLSAGVLLASIVQPARTQSYQPRGAVEFQARNGLHRFFNKLDHGGRVRVAYLGGSITAAEGWRPQSLKWFADTYPNVDFQEINAAISGTGSELGVFRLGQDVLQYSPDLLFVEFAVNDQDESVGRIERAMEGIVRQTWQRFPQTEICFIYTLNQHSLPELEAGHDPTAVEAMERVADVYRIPSINFGVPIAKAVLVGKLIMKGPHPSTGAPAAGEAVGRVG